MHAILFQPISKRCVDVGGDGHALILKQILHAQKILVDLLLSNKRKSAKTLAVVFGGKSRSIGTKFLEKDGKTDFPLHESSFNVFPGRYVY